MNNEMDLQKSKENLDKKTDTIMFSLTIKKMKRKYKDEESNINDFYLYQYI